MRVQTYVVKDVVLGHVLRRGTGLSLDAAKERVLQAAEPTKPETVEFLPDGNGGFNCRACGDITWTITPE